MTSTKRPKSKRRKTSLAIGNFWLRVLQCSTSLALKYGSLLSSAPRRSSTFLKSGNSTPAEGNGMAAKYRKIDPRMWDDEKFRLLSAGEKLIAIYAITAQSNRCGIFIYSHGLAREHLGFDRTE